MHISNCLVLPLLATLAAGQETRRPNLVFLLADDLGWTDLGCQGSTFYETPNLDGLAASGMRFTQAYAACPVCSPTRAALLTGKYPARLDTTDYFGGRRKGRLLPAPYRETLPLEELTLAGALDEAGYRTAFFGKWHLGGEGYYPEDQGFEVNVGGFERGHPPKGYFSPYGNPKLEDGPEGEQLTERLTDEALAWMESVKDEPFLLYFSYYAVHTPLQTKDAYREKYRAKKESLPATEGEEWGQERKRKVRLVQDHPVYAGMLQSLDESVGRLLAKLDALGLADDTIVMFTSDNGGLSTSEGHPTSNLPLRAGKGWLYEGGIREPFLVHWPGVTAAGSTSDQPITSCDVYPTVLEMLGLSARPDQHLDGRAFTPILRGAGSLPQRSIFWHYPHYGNQGGSPSGALRFGDWKLIEWYEDGALELYDLGADPGETRDLAAVRPRVVARLQRELARWRRSVDAKMPSPNPDWEEGR